MIDWNAELLDPIYDEFGVEAELQTAAGEPLQGVTAIDLSSGVDISGVSDISIQGLLPAASVRVKELATKNIDPDDLLDGTITLNSKSWTIKSHRPKPTPHGEADGELYLILAKAAC